MSDALGRRNVANEAVSAEVKLAELVPMRELLPKLPPNLYSSFGSAEWAWRMHRERFIAGGAVFLIAGRLLVHPPSFARVALEIGAEELARRHGDRAMSTA